MERAARITSIDALRQMRLALIAFNGDAQSSLEHLVLEARRALDWFENDRRRYWPDQVRRASDQLVQARNELERCQLRYGSEEAPSCYEQKKAVEKARRRLRLCEEKVRLTKRWLQTIRQEMNEFEGATARMYGYLENDVPRALAALDRMLAALEKYAQSGAATRSADVRPAMPGESNEFDVDKGAKPS